MMLWRFVMLLLLVVGGAIAFFTWLFWDKPGDPGTFNDQYMAMVERFQAEQADHANDWNRFAETAGAVVAATDKAVGTFGRDRPAEWPAGMGWPPVFSDLDHRGGPPVVRVKIDAMMAAVREAGCIDRLAELPRMERVVRPVPPGTMLMAGHDPAWNASRSVARCEKARMVLAHLAGDDAELARVFEESLALARILSRQGDMLEHLIAYAVVPLACETLAQRLQMRPPEVGTLRQMLGALDRQSLGSFAVALQGQKFVLQDGIEVSFTTGRGGDGSCVAGWFAEQNQNPLTQIQIRWNGLSLPRKQENLAAVDRFAEAMSTDLDLPLDARLLGYAGAQAFVRRQPPGLWVCGFMPAMDKAVQCRAYSELSLAACRLMLGLELCRHRTGSYPQGLSDLLGKDLDRFAGDEDVIALLHYALPPPRHDENAPRYTLYGDGLDGTDDGGKVHPTKGSPAALAPEGAGFDVVFMPAITSE